MKINAAEIFALNATATALGVSADTLYKLIDNESGWNPVIKNPLPGSTARGLIQLTDRAAQDIGYKTSMAAVSDFPTRESQLKNIVLPWLKRYAPYKRDADLLLQVFYPAARRMHPHDPLPAAVQKANTGIITPYDYVMRALRDPLKALAAFDKSASHLAPILLLISIGILLILKKG